MPIITRLLLFYVCFASAGCSKIQNDIRARFDLFRAEQITWKTVKMKDRKVPFEERQIYYSKACDIYVSVYGRAEHLFTAGRMEEAASSCFNAENFKGKRVFEEAYAAYCKKHPKECAYGFMTGGVE
ncbi:MAG: hypothetical protein HY587_07295 [Candidatus Omnitrophica bacterium]|nr:hypothetical protein [Candidatus Omnitrophota bacterium]